MLLIAMVLAGCTGPTQSDPNSTNNTSTTSTDIVQSFTVEPAQVYEESSATLALIMKNTRDQPLHQFRADIGNYGRLTLVRQEPASAGEQTQCKYDQIESSSFNAERRCIWEVLVGRNMVGENQQQRTVPLTSFITYSSQTVAEDSLDVSFKRRQNIYPGDQQQETVTARNKDVHLSVQHEGPVAAEEQTVPITATARNVGEGSIVAQEESDQKAVTVSFEGTLAQAQWNAQASTCMTAGEKQLRVVLEGGSKTVNCEITLQSTDLAGKTYDLRPRLSYRYMITKQAPLTVTKRE